jgi:putative intracellular protease/amidase
MKYVQLFVFDSMADWEPALAIAGLNQPDYQQDPGLYAVRTVGPTRDVVRTLGGVAIVPDQSLIELSPAATAMLILPGGSAWDQGSHGEAAALANVLLEAGVPVAAICGATAGLGRAGVLNQRRHTSNSAEYLGALPGYSGHAHYVNGLAVRDGDLITASGIAPVDFAYRIFERLEVFAPPVLEAWYALYGRHDASLFHQLAAASPAADAAGAEPAR